ncbi:MAG: hypothetical protein ACJ768_09385 [Gaiellaceae bacterium]
MSDPTQQPPEQPATPPEQPTAPEQPAPAPEQPTAPERPVDTSELERLRAQLAEAEADKQRAVAAALEQQAGQRPAPAAAANVDLAELSQHDRREKYADWPARDGDASELPQPWDLPALGLRNEMRDFEEQAKPGSRNTVSPIVIHHGRPLLTYGSSDPGVQELGRILGELGFDNSVSDGHNPFGSVDNTVMAAVYAFRDAYNVQEDPSGFGGNTPDGRQLAAAHIGPWTWEAILRVGAQLDAEAA